MAGKHFHGSATNRQQTCVHSPGLTGCPTALCFLSFRSFVFEWFPTSWTQIPGVLLQVCAALWICVSVVSLVLPVPPNASAYCVMSDERSPTYFSSPRRPRLSYPVVRRPADLGRGLYNFRTSTSTAVFHTEEPTSPGAGITWLAAKILFWIAALFGSWVGNGSVVNLQRSLRERNPWSDCCGMPVSYLLPSHLERLSRLQCRRRCSCEYPLPVRCLRWLRAVTACGCLSLDVQLDTRICIESASLRA